MKTNTSGFVFSWFNSLMVAVAIIIFSAVATAKGQNYSKAIAGVPSIPRSVTNGLFTPTQAERFFQAGREDFAREVKIFNHSELYLGDKLLQIDPELVEQMHQPQPVTNFKSSNSQYELHQGNLNY
ncbi:MAG: hypothetical protein AAF298_15995 [Cyanobacteria bacterium P01_A01_bin.40]